MAKNASIYAAFERMWQHIVNYVDNAVEKTGVVVNAVLYTEQNLTETEKSQARENIGAMSADAVIPSTDGLASEAYVDQKFDSVNGDVSGKQDKLTGTAGQIVGFDQNGNAIAQDAPAGGSGSSITIKSWTAADMV